MKKFLSLFLVVLLCLTFTACGEDDAAPTAGNDAATEATNSLVGSWVDGEGFTWTFNADGTLVLTDGSDTMQLTYSASGANLTMTMGGQTTTGTFTVANNVLTLVNADGDVKTMTKKESTAGIPVVPSVNQATTPTQAPVQSQAPVATQTANNIGAPSDEQVVSATVELIKDQLAEKFEAMFAQKGMNGTAVIRADGTRLVIDLKVVAFNNISTEQLAELQANAGSLQSVVDTMLTNIRQSLPQATGAAFNLCDGNGNVLATVSAGY